MAALIRQRSRGELEALGLKMALPRPESRSESKKGISLLQPIYSTVSLHHLLNHLFSQKHMAESLGMGQLPLERLRTERKQMSQSAEAHKLGVVSDKDP